jgi:starvation-inducible DNA-binding protein
MNSIKNVEKPEARGTASAAGLAGVLSDTYTLALKTQNYHWNVTGPDFYSLHGMFEAQYDELFEAADTIAERIRALGFPAPGSFKEFQALTAVQEASGRTAASDMVRDLAAGHRVAARSAKRALAAAEKEDDQATVDLMVERITAHEKAAWMLDSTLRA